MLNFKCDKPRDHLFIPDMQVNEMFNMDIARAVGNFIVEHKPGVIVNIGDFADMPSLSVYDVGKKSHEGKRYWKDIKAARLAQKELFKPLLQEQERLKRLHYKRYNPLKIITLGNHEERINKAIENNATLEGAISIDDLHYHKYYDVVAPFLEPVIVDGVMYKHYGFKKMPKMAMSGKHLARNLLDTYMCSISVGHTPDLHTALHHRANGEPIRAIAAGCCFDHYEPYAGQRNNRYWRGIIHKRSVKDGMYDLHEYSLDVLLRDYL